MTWREWFEQALAKYPTPWKYLFECHEYMKPVLHAARRHAPPPAFLWEAGCGIGMTAMLFVAEGYFVDGIDQDEDVLSIAGGMPWFYPFYIADKKRAVYTSTGDFVTLKLGDCLTLHRPPFDVAFSGGVIEHVDSETRIAMLKTLKANSHVQIVVIPSPLQLLCCSEKVSMGEQPISLADLVSACREAGWTVVESFGFGAPAAGTDPHQDMDPWMSLCVVGKTPGG